MTTPRARRGRTAGGYPARPPGQATTQPGRATGQEIAQPGRATGPGRRTSLRHSRRPATSSRTGRAGPSGATGAGSRRTRTLAVSPGEPDSRPEDPVRGPRGAGDRGAVRCRGPAAPGGCGWRAADTRGGCAGQLGRVRVRRPRLGGADRRLACHRGRPRLRAGWLGPDHSPGAGWRRDHGPGAGHRDSARPAAHLGGPARACPAEEPAGGPAGVKSQGHDRGRPRRRDRHRQRRDGPGPGRRASVGWPADRAVRRPQYKLVVHRTGPGHGAQHRDLPHQHRQCTR